MKEDKSIIFKGVGTATVTPFCDGEIDWETLAELIEAQIRAKVDAIVVAGTTGEAATLTGKERYELYERAAMMINGRTKLILGTGTNDTRVAVEHTKFASSIGADGILAVTPYYNKGTEEGVYRHYMAIADASDAPIILYNVPSRTGVNLGIGLLHRLAEHPMIRGLKEASDSVDRLSQIAEFRDTLPIYAGNDSQILPVLAYGGVGVISVVSNIFIREVVALCRAFDEGDVKRAREIQLLLLPFIRAAFLETNPAPIKCAMAMLGLCKEELRLPLAEVRQSTREELTAATSRLLRERE